MMKNLTVPALAFACAFSAGVPAAAETAEPYNPVKALRGERTAAPANDDDRGSFVLPREKRGSAVALAVAPEYFFDFGSDLPDGDGWGASLSAAVRFDTDTPNWEFLGELEFLGYTAESGHYAHNGRRVKEELQSANLLIHLGLARSFGENFVLEGLLGFGLGVTYGEVKGENFKTSSSGDLTTTVSAKLRGEYRLDENWGVFAAYRFAYVSPSIASRVADWRSLDLFAQSVEIGLRYRF